MNQEEIIEYYYGIIRIIVKKIVVKLPEGYEEEDFVQIGMMGLLKALDNWDSSKTLSEFKSYANTKIRGAILDKLRSVDKISRYSRDRLKKIATVYRNFMNQGIFDPSDEMVAKQANLTLDEFNNLLYEQSNNTILSIDRITSDDGGLFIESLENKNSKNPLTMIEDKEVQEAIKEGLSNLNETELNVISLYYYEDFNMKEIASIIEKTESRVSQIKTKAIIKLKEFVRRRLNNE